MRINDSPKKGVGGSLNLSDYVEQQATARGLKKGMQQGMQLG